MLVPLSWLMDFAPFHLDPGELGETFDDLGMVVEGIERVGDGIDGVVVARVLEVSSHPAADRVRLTQVDTGDGRPRQVVCGAPNVAAGQLVFLATIGTVLPGGMEIARRKVRGEWSEGMICSPVELGLGDEGAGILVLPEGPEPGTAMADALGGADVVYDLAIEANRPDALSVAGVARDAAARLGLPFTLPEPVLAPGPPVAVAGELATVAVESPELCPRFTARVITGVAVGPSPPWMARRLTLAGMRPISNVVDASNYVMLELGQPTHPYDLDRLPGRGLLVRRAGPGEILVTLDGVERRLGDGDDCLICDATGTPVGIGGIMGGASSEISPSTTTVLLEAAYFTPMVIARTAKRLGLRTEASARFERGCDPLGIERATDRLCQLLCLPPGTAKVAAGRLDRSTLAPPPPPIRVRTARVNAVLGTDLDDATVRTLLGPIGFTAEPAGPGHTAVVPPSFRPDAGTEIDVVEEVARHLGYSRIPRTRPTSPFVGRLSPYQ
ncbi:MAG: phenylalanine--tRNA ligase subunit beta, partial [Acidimicrobiales bacterium]